MFAFTPKPKRFLTFRNIATCAPSQNLFDDLTGPERFGDMHRHERASSAINHGKGKKNRPFQYGDTGLTLYVFEEINWTYGRFSSGTRYGVWYGALEEDTSVTEIAYHRAREAKDLFANPKIIDPFIVHQRAMFQARCDAKTMVDLRKEKEPGLVSDDYAYGHRLGAWAASNGIDAFFTPSARKPGGVCTPIFNPKIIKDGFLYYFDLIIRRDFAVEFRKQEARKISFTSPPF